MAWKDKPTYAQLELLYQWFRWEMPTPKAKDAVHWLEDNADRQQVSNEIKRIKELQVNKQLNGQECFSSSVWEKYPFKEATCNLED